MPQTSRDLHNKIAAILAVVVVVVAATYFYMHRNPTPTVGQSASSTATTTEVNGVTVSGGTATVVATTPASTVQTPDFRTPLSFGSSVSADVRTALTNQFDATVKILAGDKLNFDAWVNLGTLRKVTGDYTGAETDWKYAASLYPKSTVPSDNLGELYLDYLKNYPKAEASFKLSITNDPHDINAYQQLASLYMVYGYKDKTTALALVEQGLKANPNNQTLLQLQSQLQSN